jgi:glycosyltransferase involved in cell wall biosynthesis
MKPTNQPQKKIALLGHQSSFDIIVPFYNSEPYMDLVLGYYQAAGYSPICVVDRKSQDRTEEIAKSLSNSIILNESKSPVIEDMIADITGRAKSRWILRIDDDELPTKALLRYAEKMTSMNHGDVHGFIRHQCGIRSDGLLMHHIDHSPQEHRQWRLYRADKVSWKSQIHSPGFHLNGLHTIHAPDSAAMIHLDWALHSHAERSRKVDRYNRVSAGAGSHWRHYYLYEDEKNFRSKFVPLQAEEFAHISSMISKRFPSNCLCQ